MIPYFTIPSLFGVIHAFGVLVACGILLGAWMLRKRARQLNLDDQAASALASYLAIVGFIVAHLFSVIAYRPDEMLQNPWILIDPRTFTISSFGGFLGGFLGLVLWGRKYHQPLFDYAEASAFGLPFGWFFGRLGCFSAHDHPGSLTTFFLGVQFPGGVRHDLGFYEAIFSFFICISFLLAFRRPRPVGTYLAWLCILYAPVRFFLDFLRATDLPGSDARYFDLTPGQYGAIAVFIVGIAIAIYARRRHQRELASATTP